MTFPLHDIFISNGYRIIEYTTRFNQRRFDIQPYRGEKTVRIPFENQDGSWEVKEFPIQFLP